MAKPKKAASEAAEKKEAKPREPRVQKEPGEPKAQAKTKESKTAEKKTGTHEAVQEFRDYAESTDGRGYKVYAKGEDVSHLPESKLKTFVDANLVKKISQ